MQERGGVLIGQAVVYRHVFKEAQNILFEERVGLTVVEFGIDHDSALVAFNTDPKVLLGGSSSSGPEIASQVSSHQPTLKAALAQHTV
jgi:hypothetical protein